MQFFLQKLTDGSLDIDVRILQDELKKQRFFHEYDTFNMDNLVHRLENCEKTKMKEVIPVGDLDFVGLFLKEVHGIENMNPIEVPDVLRQDKFLKRKYSIVGLDELPKEGMFFTKYVSKLKQFSHTGMIETLQYQDVGKEPFLKPGLYQVSEVVDILVEYRCFIHNDKLIAMNYYDGDCTVFPDVKELRSMICTYMLDKNRPKAYTMDIAVIKNRGTAILEVHPWVSVGLYSYMFGSDLPYCYRDGFLYYIENNQEIHKFSNF